MTEIEKMFENAGIEKKFEKPAECLKNPYITCDGCMLYDDKKGKCNNKKDYPPFTAEKQIDILMFILNKFGDIGFQKMYSIRGNDENTRKDYIKCLCDCEHETWDSRPVDFYYQNGAYGDNLEESLAGLINKLWQDLTNQEKEEIRNILNENS